MSTRRDRSHKRLRNLNDVDLAIERYRYDVKMHEHVLFSGLRDVRRSLAYSLGEAVRAYTQQWVMIKVMKWVQSALYKRRKKKKEESD